MTAHGIAAAHGVVICPVVPYPVVSGASKRILRLLEAMERAGVHPHVLATDADGREGAGVLRERGWSVDLVPEPPATPARRLAQHVARRPSPYVPGVEHRLRAMRAPPPAFVQAEHAMSAYYADAHPGPSILSMHNVDSELLATVARGHRPLTPSWTRAWNRALATRTVERRAARRAGAVLCVSDADAAHFERLGCRIVMAPNGIDDDLLDLPAALPADDTVLFFGHLGYAPNLHGLRRFVREGWPRLRAAAPRARLRIVGPGLTLALARELRGHGGVEPAGLVADIRPELAASALVIVPIWQGGGTRLKVLEALAAARPVVSTPLGAAGLGFRDGVEGVLAERPAELADAAAAVLADRARAVALGAAGRRLAERFRWTRTLAGAEALYGRLAGTRT